MSKESRHNLIYEVVKGFVYHNFFHYKLSKLIGKLANIISSYIISPCRKYKISSLSSTIQFRKFLYEWKMNTLTGWPNRDYYKKNCKLMQIDY